LVISVYFRVCKITHFLKAKLHYGKIIFSKLTT
jgi:hypothetical protein